MKRKDLTVGQDYLLNTSNEWESPYAWRAAERVKVLSDRPLVPHATYGYGSKREPLALRMADGTPVMIPGTHQPVTVRNGRDKQYPGDVANAIAVAQVLDNGRVDFSKARVVMTAHLRAPWAEGSARVQAAKDAKAAAERAATDAAAERLERLSAIQAALERAGHPMPHLTLHWGRESAEIRGVYLADLEAIAALLAAKREG